MSVLHLKVNTATSSLGVRPLAIVVPFLLLMATHLNGKLTNGAMAQTIH